MQGILGKIITWYPLFFGAHPPPLSFTGFPRTIPANSPSPQHHSSSAPFSVRRELHATKYGPHIKGNNLSFADISLKLAKCGYVRVWRGPIVSCLVTPPHHLLHWGHLVVECDSVTWTYCFMLDHPTPPPTSLRPPGGRMCLHPTNWQVATIFDTNWINTSMYPLFSLVFFAVTRCLHCWCDSFFAVVIYWGFIFLWQEVALLSEIGVNWFISFKLIGIIFWQLFISRFHCK